MSRWSLLGQGSTGEPVGVLSRGGPTARHGHKMCRKSPDEKNGYKKLINQSGSLLKCFLGAVFGHGVFGGGGGARNYHGQISGRFVQPPSFRVWCFRAPGRKINSFCPWHERASYEVPQRLMSAERPGHIDHRRGGSVALWQQLGTIHASGATRAKCPWITWLPCVRKKNTS